MRKLMLATTALVTAAVCMTGAASSAHAAKWKGPAGLAKIGHIVVIYAENHSFDEEFGGFPGANGLRRALPSQYVQLDRGGSVLPMLPPVFGGVIDSHEVAPNGQQYTQIPQSATTNLANAPFSINGASGFNLPASVATRDLYHRFYENQMQINGGKNNKFAAWADSGGLVMGHYDHNPATKDQHPLWQLAKEFVLADNFYQAAFGGSYLNHQYLICACANTFTPAQQTRPKVSGPGNVVVPISVLNADGVTLTTAANSPASALNGPPVFVGSTTLTPFDAAAGVYYGVNTMQPAYIPSGNGVGTPQTSVNLDSATTVPPQTNTTIGDLLNAAGVSWAWYAGALQYAIDHGVYNGAAGLDPHGNLVPNFQAHHNPFNYYLNFAPGTQARTVHLKDGGLGGNKFIQDVDAGHLPAVTFYKPEGNQNSHPGYTDLTLGDQHVIDVVNHLMNGPQWKDMVIVITYDEFGGQWDHAAPPKGDMFGPGTRIPAIIVSPFAKRHKVDHTQYDTTSILKLITERYSLPVLPGLQRRDHGLVAHGGVKNGDLTAALRLNKSDSDD